MNYDIENVLDIVKNDPAAIIYSEVFLEEIVRRNILESMVDDFLQFRKPILIKRFCNLEYRFELHYAWDNSNDLIIVADVFNLKNLILISAFPKRRANSIDDFDEGEVQMRKIYDQPYGMVTLCVVDGFRYGQTIIVEEGFYIDFDVYGYPVSVVMFGVSKRFKLRPNEFLSCRMKGSIEITNDSIRIEVNVTVKFRQMTTRVVEHEIPNVYGFSPNEFVLKIVNA